MLSLHFNALKCVNCTIVYAVYQCTAQHTADIVESSNEMNVHVRVRVWKE